MPELRRRRLSRLPRRAHRLYARANGYFWLPCPVCGRMSGGHERRDIDGLPSAVPVPEEGAGRSRSICPGCARDGYGYPPHWSFDSAEGSAS